MGLFTLFPQSTYKQGKHKSLLYIFFESILLPLLKNGTSLAPTSSSPELYFSFSTASSMVYGYYLSPCFMSPMPHQFLGPNGLPQQPSIGNFISPAAPSAAVKYPLSQFKPRTNAGNPAHVGLRPGYGPYSSSLLVSILLQLGPLRSLTRILFHFLFVTFCP